MIFPKGGEGVEEHGRDSSEGTTGQISSFSVVGSSVATRRGEEEEVDLAIALLPAPTPLQGVNASAVGW